MATDELFLRDTDVGVAAPESSLGEVGGEATFCWSMVEAARATVLGFVELDTAFVVAVVTVDVVGKVDDVPSLGLALGLVVVATVATAAADDLRLFFPPPGLPDD